MHEDVLKSYFQTFTSVAQAEEWLKTFEDVVLSHPAVPESDTFMCDLEGQSLRELMIGLTLCSSQSIYT